MNPAYAIREGMTLRVVSTPNRMPGNQRPPFVAGDLVLCKRITPVGSVLTDKHGGLFPQHRFEKA